MWSSSGLSPYRPPSPAPTRRESDRKQKQPDTVPGEARQNQLCYFGTWLIPPRAPPPSRSQGSCPLQVFSALPSSGGQSGFPSLYELVFKAGVWTAGREVLASRVLVRGWVLGQCAPAWWELAEASDPKPPCPALPCSVSLTNSQASCQLQLRGGS